MKSFWSSEAAVRYLAARNGSADYNNWQAIPWTFYSYVDYGVAGASSFTFFADAVGTGGTNRQLTNMPKASSFGQQNFLLKRIRCSYFCPNPATDGWDGTNPSALYGDLINGLFQAGYFQMEIQNKVFITFPKPFLTAGGDYGPGALHYAGIEALTLSAATPDELATYRSHAPEATLNHARDQRYLVDPNILLEAEQNFTVNINYDTGALAPIATDVVSGANTLFIGVELDGLLLRPVQ